MRTVAIVLAAGGSSRLGTPKQLVRRDGRTLVAAAAENCLAAGCDEVLVVVGCRAEEVAAAVAHLPVAIVRNNDWALGQASSLKAGVQHVLSRSEMPSNVAERLLVTLCDMPAVTSEHLQSLLARCSTTTPVAATAYPDGGGVPACFQRCLIEELLRVSGDQGAKELIRSHGRDIALISLAGAETDIDVSADLTK